MINGMNHAGGMVLSPPLPNGSALMYDKEHAHQLLQQRDGGRHDPTGVMNDDDQEDEHNEDSVSPRSCPVTPELGEMAFDPISAFAAAAAAGMGRSSSWPVPLPPDMLELPQSFMRGHPMCAGIPAPPLVASAPRCSKTQALSISAGPGSRKNKQDAARASAVVRNRRQSYADQRTCRSRSTQSASPGSRKNKQDAARASAMGRNRRKSCADQRMGQSRSNESASETGEKSTQPQTRTQVASRLPPSRTSFSRPSTANSSDGASSINMTPTSPSTTSSIASSGFTIIDEIVLRPRPGSGDEEIAYPCATDSLSDTQNNSGPTIDAVHQAEEAVEQVRNLFPSDLYAPRFTRRGKCGREGWCSLCPQGEWYSMKRSQYLYHMQFDHGISNLTRRFFHPPQHLRVWNDAVSKTDGFCHHCKKWIPICFGPQRKREFKVWFKHARKCHRDDTGCPI